VKPLGCETMTGSAYAAATDASRGTLQLGPAEVYLATDELDVERAGLTAVEWLALKRGRIRVPATRPPTGKRWLAPLRTWELPFAASS
jgi:hypothetical protein